MDSVVRGGCLCGTVRYEYSGQLGAANYCHCGDCRKATGSAFNIGVRVDAAELRIVSGQVKRFTKQGDSGNSITREFCSECGSPLFTRSPSRPQFVWIKAGSLNDPSQIEPTYQNWTDSAVPWAYISSNLTSYARNRTTL